MNDESQQFGRTARQILRGLEDAMELRGFKNIREVGFEDALRGAGVMFDMFFSDAVWAKYIQSPNKKLMDTRIYDVIFMSQLQVRHLPGNFRVITKRGEVTLVKHFHKQMMAVCISMPYEIGEQVSSPSLSPKAG